ncbi:MAG: hypothetical protein M3Q44_07985 [bacterium]|nr:hypothetical protein [bacterium]
MRLTRASITILCYYIIIVTWWFVLYVQGIKFSPINYWYQFAFGLIPLIGGITGMIRAHEWGLFKSKVGIALACISAGLITWGIGQMFWSIYYNVILGIEVPYPSLADIGYILSWPLWSIGIIHLARATGAHVSLKSMMGKLLLFIVPIIFIALSYYLLIVVARDGTITDLSESYAKIFFDLAYPIGDVVILTLAVLIFGLSINYLGGKYRISILTLLLGFVINYIVDFAFSYTTTQETYYNGHWVDLLFPTAMMLIAVAVNNFSTEVD